MAPSVFEGDAIRARGCRWEASQYSVGSAVAASLGQTRGEPAAQPSEGHAAADTAGRWRGDPGTELEGSRGERSTVPGSAALETFQVSMRSEAALCGLHPVNIYLIKQIIQACS